MVIKRKILILYIFLFWEISWHIYVQKSNVEDDYLLPTIIPVKYINSRKFQNINKASIFFIIQGKIAINILMIILLVIFIPMYILKISEYSKYAVL